MSSRLVRAFLALVAALAAGMWTPLAPAAGTPLDETVSISIWAYDTPPHDAPGTDAVSERGPPASCARSATSRDAVSDWAQSVPSRRESPSSGSTTTYTTTTTGAQEEAIDGEPSSSQRSGVAANGERLLAKADRIEAHLARPEIEYAAKNDAMLARIRSAAAEGTALSGADRAFMRHELTENWLMNRGLGIDLAHKISGWTHRTYGNFDPSVIKQLPQEFNSSWRRFWDIE